MKYIHRCLFLTDEKKLPLNPLITASGSKKTQKDAQNDEEKQKKSEISIAEDALFPPNYDACLQSLKLVYIYALGLSGVGMYVMSLFLVGLIC